jgi:hypothetical protein
VDGDDGVGHDVKRRRRDQAEPIMNASDTSCTCIRRDRRKILLRRKGLLRCLISDLISPHGGYSSARCRTRIHC